MSSSSVCDLFQLMYEHGASVCDLVKVLDHYRVKDVEKIIMCQQLGAFFLRNNNIYSDDERVVLNRCILKTTTVLMDRELNLNRKSRDEYYGDSGLKDLLSCSSSSSSSSSSSASLAAATTTTTTTIAKPHKRIVTCPVKISGYAMTEIIDILKVQDLLYDSRIHKGSPWEETSHVTIHVKLDPAVAGTKLIERLATLKKMQFSVSKLDRFERDIVIDKEHVKFDVLRLEIEDANVIALHELVVKETKTPYDFNPPVLHITIAYLKPGTGAKYATTLSKPLLAEISEIIIEDMGTHENSTTIPLL